MVPTQLAESCQDAKRKCHNIMSPARAWCDGQEYPRRVLDVFGDCNFLDLCLHQKGLR